MSRDNNKRIPINQSNRINLLCMSTNEIAPL